jgi:hypothetical protein
MELRDIIDSCIEIAEPVLEEAKTKNWKTLLDIANTYQNKANKLSLMATHGYDYDQLVNDGIYAELAEPMKNRLAFEAFYYHWLSDKLMSQATINFTKS